MCGNTSSRGSRFRNSSAGDYLFRSFANRETWFYIYLEAQIFFWKTTGCMHDARKFHQSLGDMFLFHFYCLKLYTYRAKSKTYVNNTMYIPE